jgi:hypothetical protein
MTGQRVFLPAIVPAVIDASAQRLRVERNTERRRRDPVFRRREGERGPLVTIGFRLVNRSDPHDGQIERLALFAAALMMLSPAGVRKSPTRRSLSASAISAHADLEVRLGVSRSSRVTLSAP